MTSLWWQLRGPNRFVSRVAEELRAGKNVTLCLPEHTTDGLAEAIRVRLGDGESWPWYTIHADEQPDVKPIQILYARFVPGTTPDAIENTYGLVKEESFSGKIVWLDHFSKSTWPAWKEFLREYEHACGARSVFERTLFCTELKGELSLDPPIEDVRLSLQAYRGCVSSLDMLLYASYLASEDAPTDLSSSVLIWVTAQLAQWDPRLAEVLVRCDLPDVLSPLPVLRRLQAERGWDRQDSAQHSDSQYWASGIVDWVDGERKMHSAFLPNGDSANLIGQRIWSGEVSVLLPYVEDRRQQTLKDLKGILRVPFTTRFGEIISDLADLEIGHIETQLNMNGSSVNPEKKNHIRRLREIRNSLAHLQPVSLNLLLEEGVENGK